MNNPEVLIDNLPYILRSLYYDAVDEQRCQEEHKQEALGKIKILKRITWVLLGITAVVGGATIPVLGSSVSLFLTLIPATAMFMLLGHTYRLDNEISWLESKSLNAEFTQQMLITYASTQDIQPDGTSRYWEESLTTTEQQDSHPRGTPEQMDRLLDAVLNAPLDDPQATQEYLDARTKPDTDQSFQRLQDSDPVHDAAIPLRDYAKFYSKILKKENSTDDKS